MTIIQREYPGRLPYGFWFDKRNRTEHIFDRGYNGMASRSVDEPWKVIVHQQRHYIGGHSEAWFYSDATCPQRSQAALKRAERVLSRFLLGHDVRAFLQDQARKPQTGGKYLPSYLRPLDPRVSLIAVEEKTHPI
ncbi:MAG: hypothetical protein HRU33_12170 [Rhodobacteraceae bacterium]|nr:hypothetical protein [Paracoccaceae bacterium]